MATLNDLRTKGAVILSIIIGVALIAFLLGDFLNTGSSLINSRKMRVGEIDGNKIGYTEYNNQTTYYTNIYQMLWGTTSLNAQQYEMVYNMAWENLLLKDSYEPSFNRMGLTVSKAEQVDMINGVYVSPVITSMFTNPQTGTFEPEIMNGFLANVEANSDAYQLWSYIKEQIVYQRRMANLSSLVKEGFFVTDLEADYGVQMSDKNCNAVVVMQPYTAIADSLVNAGINGTKVKEYYAKHKEQFKQSPTRDVEYVLFDVLPSQGDYDEAAATVKTLAEEFAAAENPMQFATSNSQTKPSTRFLKESEMTAEYAAIAFGADKGSMFGPSLSGDTYTIARVAQTKSMPDTLGARHILLAADQQQRADSLVAVLKKGGNFAELSSQFSLDEAAKQQGGDLGFFAPEQMIEEFTDACLKAKKGDIFTVTSQYGIHVVELTAKSPSIEKAQIAAITYKVDPSEATEQSAYNKASAFLTAAAGTSEGFNEAVNDQSLSKRSVRIRNTDRTITGLENAKELIRWAYNNKQGSVSTIMEIDGNYVVAMLNDVKESDYATLKDATQGIYQILLNKAKVNYVEQKIAGATTIDEVAGKLGVQTTQADNVNFNSFYVAGIGVEPALVGAICNTPANQLSKPVEGYGNVFLYTVTEVAPQGDVTAESEKIRMEANATSYLNERLNQALVEQSHVKDYRIKFF